MNACLLWLQTRLKSSMESGLLWVGKWAVILWGVAGVTVWTRQQIDDTEIFFNPRYVNFWQDAEAYNLRTEGWKSESELGQLYGTNRVESYITHGASGMFLPSEEANLVACKSVILSYQDPSGESGNANGRRLFIKKTVIVIIILYLPMVLAIRKGQQILAVFFCCSDEAYAARRAYFEGFHLKALVRTVPISLTIVLLLSYINARLQLTNDMQALGITSFDMAVSLVFVSCLAGVGVLIVYSLVDVVFMVFAINPHHTIWDDLLTAAIMAPILVCIYKNSWITVVAAMVTGLAAGLMMKWMVWSRKGCCDKC